MWKLLVHIYDCFFVSKQLVQRLHLYIINIFNVLRKVDIVFNTVVINITFVGIIILKISMFEGKMNFKGILVKFLLMNIAIKQFILKVFNFKFLSLIFSDNISCFKICLWQFFCKTEIKLWLIIIWDFQLIWIQCWFGIFFSDFFPLYL